MPPAVIDGHVLLARVRHFPGRNSVTDAASPAQEEKARHLRPACDHCRQSRRWHETYLFFDPAGMTVQVAAPCLRDYFPGQPDEAFDRLTASEMTTAYVNPEPVLSAIALLREREPTADHETLLGMLLTALEVADTGGLEDDVIEVLYDGAALPAEAPIVSWARGPLRKEIDAALAAGGRVNARFVTAANALEDALIPRDAVKWLLTVHEVYDEWLAAQAAKPPESEWVGEVREKGEKAHRPRLRLRLTGKLGPFSGDYGDRYGYVFVQDGTPNRLIWWTTSKPGVEIGETAEFDCTISAHSAYQGVRQTVVTRVKRVDPALEAAKERDRRGTDNTADSD